MTKADTRAIFNQSHRRCIDPIIWARRVTPFLIIRVNPAVSNIPANHDPVTGGSMGEAS